MGLVFLSHSSKDKEFVRELYRRLTRDGVRCFFDAESIGWGDNWVCALERAVDECSDIVFVLSPDFCVSEWVRVERDSSMADDPAALKRKVRPLLFRPCAHLDSFPRFLRQVQTMDVSTPSAFEKNYPKICVALGGTVVEEVSGMDRTKLPAVCPLPARHRMPYRSMGDQFVGRVAALWELYDALHKDSTAILQGVGVLAGTGGLGKTQTAIEYVHRFGAGYQGGVYWVDSERGLSALITQVSEAAGVEVDTKASDEIQLEQLWRGLNQLPACLLVLDNFPEEGALEDYLPKGGRVQTLVTTRRRDLVGFAAVDLNVMSRAEGVALLNSGLRKLESGEAGDLVARLGGLPLALELVKSYLNYRRDVQVSTVLAEMGKSRDVSVLEGFAKAYKNKLPSGHERDVVRTFQLSWDVAPEGARDVLRVMAEVAPVGVPREVIREVLGLAEPEGLQDELAERISELVRLSLVELDLSGNPVMHRLVHGFVGWRSGLDGVDFFERVAAVVSEQMGATNQNPGVAVMRELELLLPHAEAVVERDRLSAEASISLLSRIGNHQQDMGRFSLSLQFSRAALERAEKSFAAGHPSIAIRQSNLALVLRDLGELAEARDLLRRALASAEKSFAAGHPSIAIRQSNLAMVLKDLGELAEARDLLRRALASAEKSFAAGHPSIAISQSNLATVLRALGELAEARDLLRRALASAEKSFAAGHPSIAISQSNLALVLRALGELAEARDLLRRALAADEKSFAAGHPSIAGSQSNLAAVLRDLGELAEARDLLRRALAGLENYGPDFPLLVTVRGNLVGVLREMGLDAEADELVSRASAAGQG